MGQPATPPPPLPEEAITVRFTVTGTTAAILRQLAAVEGRSPEELATEWASGALVIPGRPIGENPEFSDWGIFDGPADLSSKVDEIMRGEATA